MQGTLSVSNHPLLALVALGTLASPLPTCSPSLSTCCASPLSPDGSGGMVVVVVVVSVTGATAFRWGLGWGLVASPGPSSGAVYCTRGQPLARMGLNARCEV